MRASIPPPTGAPTWAEKKDVRIRQPIRVSGGGQGRETRLTPERAAPKNVLPGTGGELARDGAAESKASIRTNRFSPIFSSAFVFFLLLFCFFGCLASLRTDACPHCGFLPWQMTGWGRMKCRCSAAYSSG
uniref:Uncharacterized protein n=1 Tax=Leishmania guyanensis TaxID=5670 RepID=A0A1E1IX76_LEIGU|nr:Hypothetical protein BN36_2333150 [Leishmania guyanensis]